MCVLINLPVTISLSDRLGDFFSIRFLTQSASDHTKVSQTGLKKKRFVRPWYGYWGPGVKCLRKKPWSDRPWYGHWGLLNLYGHWCVKILELILWNLSQSLCRYTSRIFRVFVAIASETSSWPSWNHDYRLLWSRMPKCSSSWSGRIVGVSHGHL